MSKKAKRPKKKKPQKSQKTKKAPKVASQTARASRPKAKAAQSGPVLTINSYAQFKSEVLESDKPVIVDFWAPWCGPCKMMAPTFLAAGTEHQEDVLFAKVDTDDHPKIAQEFNIRALPTLMAFHEGEINNIHTGVINRRGLDKEVERLMKFVAKKEAKEAKKEAKETSKSATPSEEKSSPGLLKRMFGLG